MFAQHHDTMHGPGCVPVRPTRERCNLRQSTKVTQALHLRTFPQAQGAMRPRQLRNVGIRHAVRFARASQHTADDAGAGLQPQELRQCGDDSFGLAAVAYLPSVGPCKFPAVAAQIAR